MTDLVARLREALEELGGWASAHAGDPFADAVLRRCAADRKILDLHDIRYEPHEIEGEPGEPDTIIWCATCNEGGYCTTVTALAEAYGVEA